MTNNSTDATTTSAGEQKIKDDATRRGQGFFGKPLVEKLKLIAVFAGMAVILYFSRPTLQSFSAGALLVVIGTLIRIWAGGHLTRDQKLTTSGPYQYTRNPFYLGRLLWIIGFAVMAGIGLNFSDWRNLLIWAVVILAILIFFAFYMPRKEEREGGRLKKLFGPDYETWKNNVPSLFPRLTPYVMNPRPWNKDLYMGNSAEFMGNKEVWTTLVVLVLIALFYLRMVTLPGVSP